MMMTTTTKKKKKIIHKVKEEKKPINPGGGGGGPDRMSELPVEILHHILGFLEMDEFLIRTSLVSTKWRNLWKSVSNLNFPTSTIIRRIVDGGGGGIRNNIKKYHNFVDHVLRLRDYEASKIHIFRYSCISAFIIGYDYLVRLHKLIVNGVVNQGAQEIQISMVRYYRERVAGNNPNMIIQFNPSIFTSGERLRKFTFKLFNHVHFLIQFPRSMCCATHLTHLFVSNIRLPEGDDSSSNAAELHLVCPVLDTLLLHRCYSKHLKVLDISAPKLKTLTICNTGMRDGHFDGLGECRLEIHTPKLTYFDYSGCVFVDCFTENLPCITIADLKLSKETDDMVEKTNSFAIKFLKGLTSAESLTLRGFELDTLRDIFTPFTRLKSLSLTTSCNISSINGMVHILNNCSNSLEILYWDVDEISTVEGDNEHLMIPQCILSHLEYVYIVGLRGHENEIEFVKFLLKSSIVLEEIIINTARDSPKISIEENLKQFIEEEPSFRSIELQIL